MGAPGGGGPEGRRRKGTAGMSFGKSFIAVTALTAALLIPIPVTDGADAAAGTTCVAKMDSTTLDPGLSTEATPNTFYNNGEGTIECDGAIHGREPTGPGVWTSNTGHFEGTCANGGKGTFVHSFRIPTKDGEVGFGNAGSFTFGALQGGLIGGEVDGEEASGTFSVAPKTGNCVSAPVTEITVIELKMTLKH